MDEVEERLDRAFARQDWMDTEMTERIRCSTDLDVCFPSAFQGSNQIL